MRILITFSINPEKGDQLIKEGRIGETMGSRRCGQKTIRARKTNLL